MRCERIKNSNEFSKKETELPISFQFLFLLIEVADCQISAYKFVKWDNLVVKTRQAC